MIRCQVLVAGAGPVGAVLAYYLARAGIDTVMIDAAPDNTQDLRASTFHAPTLEMLDELGIADELIELGLKAPVYHFRERKTGSVIDFDLSELTGEQRYPFRLQCEQFHLANMLARRLEQHPRARVLFNHRLTHFSEVADGVEAIAETPLEVERFHAEYLIGADGASSFVRKLLGIEFTGFTYPEKFLCMTTKEPLEQYLPNLAAVNYVSDPDEWMVILKVPSMWRVLIPADGNDAELLSDERKEKLFGDLIGKPDVKTEHRTIYRVHQRVANTFRVGRIAIIGDAAHLNNPLGGFGMNSGIHDAFNLGDKLVRTLVDRLPADPLLDLFERQRRTITHDFIQAQTMSNHRYMREGEHEVHRLRKAEMQAMHDDPVRRRQYLRRQAMIDCVADEAKIA